MDGVHPPRLRAAAEWRWRVLLLSCPSVVVQLVPCLSQCSTDEYCRRVVCCSVPGVWCAGSEYLFEVLCGGVSSVRSPLVVVVDGALVDGGVV